MVCVQGALDYLNASLAKLKVSPIGGGYRLAEVQTRTCAERNYTDGPKQEACFVQATLWMDHDPVHLGLAPVTEPMLMAAYAVNHSFVELVTGMSELCGTSDGS
uniref:Uncharacterized protein n=1 Tax=Zooxanthella nutricula TaxID=1333877 RepID=A0A7S2Q6S6_9DINO